MILISILLHETATTAIYTYCHTLSLHDALPISFLPRWDGIDQDGAEIIHIGSRRPGDKQRVEPREKRSEEHTTELQSLMRISYAVFCSNKTYSLDVIDYLTAVHISGGIRKSYAHSSAIQSPIDIQSAGF